MTGICLWIVSMPVELIGRVISVFGVAFGVAMFICFAFLCIKILLAPKDLIVFDGENLYLPDGICPLSDLRNVIYRSATRWGDSWGTVILQTAAGDRKYRFVADMEKVHNRLIQLMMQAREKEN